MAAAWHLRWLQDDAYITFVYSRNLASGLGPVWNPGYVVEGYTNFLWMVLLAGARLAGFSIPIASQVLSIGCFGATLLTVFALARLLFRHDGWALLATALLAANYSFLKYATGGLETQLHVALTTAALLVLARVGDDGRATAPRALGLSALTGLAVLTRPDSVLLAGTALAFMAAHLFARRVPRAQRVLLLASLVGPAAAIVVPWLLWKQSFYGHLLPNTFLAKVGAYRPRTMLRGLAYVAWPFLSFAWLPVLAWLAVRLRGRIWPWRPALRPLVVFGVLWVAYLVRVGGDIMEFRLLECIFPLVILTIVAGVRASYTSPLSVVVPSLVLLGATAVHARFFARYVRPQGIGNIPTLTEFGMQCCEIGEKLRSDLGPASGVKIAVSPAGAIPYCSGLPAVDILGLNDLWVARHGFLRRTCDVCAAHARMATIEYLDSAGANLVFGHPREARPEPEAPRDAFEAMFWDEPLDYDRAPEGAQLVRIPIGADRAVLAVYLEPNPAIDGLIARGAWSAEPLRRGK